MHKRCSVMFNHGITNILRYESQGIQHVFQVIMGWPVIWAHGKPIIQYFNKNSTLSTCSNSSLTVALYMLSETVQAEMLEDKLPISDFHVFIASVLRQKQTSPFRVRELPMPLPVSEVPRYNKNTKSTHENMIRHQPPHPKRMRWWGGQKA